MSGKREITHIVVHTAAAAAKGKPVDQSAATIRAYHKSKGWSDIGYNILIRFDGSIEPGRPMSKAGAHVEGFNASTIGICCTGHGDIADFTAKQKHALTHLICDLLRDYGLVQTFRKNMMRVLGHRECYQLPGVPNTGKTCPGTKVDMKAIRLAVAAELDRRGL